LLCNDLPMRNDQKSVLKIAVIANDGIGDFRISRLFIDVFKDLLVMLTWLTNHFSLS